MRIIPFITALLVGGFLIGIVLYRPALIEFAGGGGAEASQSEDAATLAAGEGTDAEDTPTSAIVDDVVRVIALRSEAREVDSAVILRGETEAARTVEVRSETSSTVTSEPLRSGAFVEAGQMLCSLDAGTRQAVVAEAQARLAEAIARQPETAARIPEAEARIPEAQARLIEAQARLEEALVNYNAATRLQTDGFASETRVKNAEAAVRSAEAAIIAAEASVKSASAGVEAATAGLDSTKAAIQSAEASVAAAEKEIERLTIVAPFAGILDEDTAELGALLQPGGLCATILQLDPIKLVGFVPETEVQRIEIGAAATAQLATGAEVSGAVSFLARSADMATRTFRVEIEVPNPDLAIREGQTTEITIAAPGDLAHLLPQSALTLNDSGALGVRTVGAGSVARFIPVSVLRDARDGVWVAGLPEQVSVITVGQEFVIDGVPIEAVYEEEHGQ